MSGQLDSIIEWLKSNTTKFFVYNYVRVEPTDSDGYFGNSSFDILWNLSSASYGWIMLRSDNPKSVLFGRLVSGNAQWDIPVFKSDLDKVAKIDRSTSSAWVGDKDSNMIFNCNFNSKTLTVTFTDGKNVTFQGQ